MKDDYIPKYLTSYYYCKLCPESKSHKYECVKSTGNCKPFEQLAATSRNKRFSFYLKKGAPKTFTKGAFNRAAYTMTNNRNISGIYLVEVGANNAETSTALYGYGDTGNLCELFNLFWETDKRFFIRLKKDDFSAVEIFTYDSNAINRDFDSRASKTTKGKTHTLSQAAAVRLFAEGAFKDDVSTLRHRARLLVVEPIKYPTLFE